MDDLQNAGAVVNVTTSELPESHDIALYIHRRASINFDENKVSLTIFNIP